MCKQRCLFDVLEYYIKAKQHMERVVWISWRREGVRGDDLVGHIKVLRCSEGCPDPVLFYTLTAPEIKLVDINRNMTTRYFHKCWYFDL